jgi:hypothetical protein
MTAKCGARTRAGGQCKREAGWGTDHVGYGSCKLHGGRTHSNTTAAYRAEAMAYAAKAHGLDDLQPTDALLMCVRDAAGMKAFAQARVAELEPDELMAEGKLHPWATLQLEATDRTARYSKMCLDAGVAERMVRLAENMGRLLAAAFATAVAPLDLSDKKRQEVVRRFGKAIAELEQADPEALEGSTAS